MYDSDEEHGIELPGPWRGSNRDYVYDQEDNFNYNINSSNNGTNGHSEGSNGSGSGSGGGVSFVGDKNFESPNKVSFILHLNVACIYSDIRLHKCARFFASV